MSQLTSRENEGAEGAAEEEEDMEEEEEEEDMDRDWREAYTYSLDRIFAGSEADDDHDGGDDSDDDSAFGSEIRTVEMDSSTETVEDGEQTNVKSPWASQRFAPLQRPKASAAAVGAAAAAPKAPAPPTSEPPPNRSPRRPPPRQQRQYQQYQQPPLAPLAQHKKHLIQHRAPSAPQEQVQQQQQQQSDPDLPSLSSLLAQALAQMEYSRQLRSPYPQRHLNPNLNLSPIPSPTTDASPSRSPSVTRNSSSKAFALPQIAPNPLDFQDSEELSWLVGCEFSLEDLGRWLRKIAREQRRKQQQQQQPRRNPASTGGLTLPAINRQEAGEDTARAEDSPRKAQDGHDLEERRENLEACEVIAWGCPSEAAVFCRSGIAARLQTLEHQRTEQARRRRDCIDEASRRSRRKASDRRRRTLAALEPQNRSGDDASAENDIGQAVEPGTDIVRAKRLMKVLTRIRATQEPLGKRLLRSQGTQPASPRKRFPSKLKKNVLESMVERQRMTQKQSRKRKRRIEDFGSLPQVEQRLLSEIFELYQDEGQTVNAAGALKCLVELGLRGNTAEERGAVKGAVFDMVSVLVRDMAADLSRRPSKEMGSVSSFRPGLSRTRTEIMLDRDEDDCECEERFGPKDRIDIYNFVSSILPVARRELYDARLDKHSYHFISALSQSGGGVSITTESLLGLASLLDIDEDISQASLLLWAHLCERLKDAETNQLRLMKGSSYLADFKAVSHSFSSSATLLPVARRLREREAVAGRSYEFDAVHYILLCGEEHTERERRARERFIQLDTGLSKNLFWNWRPELCKFHDMFLNYDVDNSGTLSYDEVKLLLKRAGLQPFSRHTALLVDQVFEPLMATKVELDFIGLLNLVEKIRRFQQDLRSHNLQREFRRFDVDNSGELSHKEAIALLHASRIAPTRVEQDVAWQLIDKFDSDQSGALNLFETETLTQHIVERIYSEATDKAFACGIEMGLDETRITLYQRIFDEADEVGAGALDLERTQGILSKYIINPPPAEAIAHIFKDVVMDGFSELSFQDFLQLMRQLGEKRRVEVREAPFTLRMVPERKLRDLLHMYPLSPAYIMGLPLEDLLENVATYTGFDIDQDLRKLAEPVRNPRQLLERIRNSRNMARKGLM